MKKITLDGVDYALIPWVEFPSNKPESYIGKKFFYKNSIAKNPPIYFVTGVDKDLVFLKYKSNSNIFSNNATISIQELIDGFKSGRIIEVEKLHGNYKIVETPKERNFDGIFIKLKKSPENIYKIISGKVSDKYPYSALAIEKGFIGGNLYNDFEKYEIEYFLTDKRWIEITEEEARELTKLTPTPIPILSLPDGNGGLYHLYEGDSAWKFNFLKDGYYKVVVTKGDIKDAKNIFPTEELAKKRLKQIEKRYSEEDILAAIGTDKTISSTQALLFRWSIQRSLNFKGYSKWYEKVQD